MPDARVLDLKPRLEDARRRPADAGAAIQQQISIVGVPVLACGGSGGFCVCRGGCRGDGLELVAVSEQAIRQAVADLQAVPVSDLQRLKDLAAKLWLATDRALQAQREARR